MKKIFVVFLFIAVFFPLKTYSQDTRVDSIQNALNYQKINYPASQYRDVYKNFMQDFYGPGHIIKEKESACQNLQKELTATEFYDGPDYEPTGFQGNFYRVNLRLIVEGKIPYSTFLNAFVESVQEITPPDPETWLVIWNEVDREIKNLGWEFDNESEDRNALMKQLSEGNYVVHHSDAYNDSVNFHYRIISKDKFNSIILPLITE